MKVQSNTWSSILNPWEMAPMRHQHRSFLCAVLASLLAAGALLLLSSRADADVPNPVQIAVIFEQAGKPYTGPVRFAIICYGYSYTAGPDPELAAGSYTPEPMYSLSGACAGAGCTVEEDLYLNYRHLDSCDLAGDASGVRFLVKNYARPPIAVALSFAANLASFAVGLLVF